MYVDADDKARHPGWIVVGVGGLACHSHDPGRGARHLWLEVRCEMAMEEPIPGVRGSPGNQHGSAGLHRFGDCETPLCLRVHLFLFPVACALNGEVGAVQMHRMSCHCRVDDSPMHGVTD